MAHETNIPYISRENLFIYLDRFAYRLQQKYGKAQNYVDILIVGGSALALKHGWRMTVDIDADLKFNGEISSEIRNVAKEYNITGDWLNQDFMASESYSRRLWEYSIEVCILQGYLRVFVVDDLSQLCMKATAGRAKDMDDIEKLVITCKSNNINFLEYKNRFLFLYGNQIKPKPKAERNIERLFRGGVGFFGRK